MISKAINMLRSLRRSSDFYTDEERRSCGSDITVDGSIPNDISKDTDGSLVGEIRKYDRLPHEFNTIQPRASIRMKDSENLFQEDEESLSDKLIDGQNHHDMRNQCNGDGDDGDDEDDDDDDEEVDSIMIIDENPLESKVDIKNCSYPSTTTNCKRKELLSVDDEIPGPFMIDLNDTFYPEEEVSNDSQSSFNTSPQEVFDISETEIKVIKITKMGKAEKNQQERVETMSPNQNLTRKKAAANEISRIDSFSQAGQDNITNAPTINVHHVSESSTFNTMNINPGGNIKGHVKNVEDGILRMRLPIQGTKKKKLFTLKTSQLIALVSNKYHPLHKWQDLITLENVNNLLENDKKKMIKILADFLEVKVIRLKINE